MKDIRWKAFWQTVGVISGTAALVVVTVLIVGFWGTLREAKAAPADSLQLLPSTAPEDYQVRLLRIGPFVCAIFKAKDTNWVAGDLTHHCERFSASNTAPGPGWWAFPEGC